MATLYHKPPRTDPGCDESGSTPDGPNLSFLEMAYGNERSQKRQKVQDENRDELEE